MNFDRVDRHARPTKKLHANVDRIFVGRRRRDVELRVEVAFAFFEFKHCVVRGCDRDSVVRRARQNVEPIGLRVARHEHVRDRSLRNHAHDDCDSILRFLCFDRDVLELSRLPHATNRFVIDVVGERCANANRRCRFCAQHDLRVRRIAHAHAAHDRERIDLRFRAEDLRAHRHQIISRADLGAAFLERARVHRDDRDVRDALRGAAGARAHKS